MHAHSSICILISIVVWLHVHTHEHPLHIQYLGVPIEHQTKIHFNMQLLQLCSIQLVSLHVLQTIAQHTVNACCTLCLFIAAIFCSSQLSYFHLLCFHHEMQHVWHGSRIQGKKQHWLSISLVVSVLL